MKLLAGTHYDPTTVATKAASSLLAMTALDTTNLRLTFTAPSNGVVLVRQRAVVGGAVNSPQLLLGVLDGATVKARQAPLTGHQPASANANTMHTCSFIVGGLTPGQSYTWDMAYGVELVVASSVIRYGGPNNATGNDAYGGIGFEIWDTPSLLAWAHYDPGTAVTTFPLSSPAAVTAIDTTNLRLVFTAPSSGNVIVRLRGVGSGTTNTIHSHTWAVLDGATVRGRARGVGGFNDVGSNVPLATNQLVNEATFLVTGLAGGTAYTWDAAAGVESSTASLVLKYGGPDNTTTDDAWGGFSFDVWNPDSLPRMIGSVA